MKVLQIHTKYRQSGGEDTVVQAEAALLRDAGHTVTLFEAQNHSGRAAVVQLGAAVWNPRSAKRLAEHIASDRPDVAHIHNTWFAMSPSVVRVLHKANVPTVMTLHNYRLTCSNALLLRDGKPCEKCVEGSALQAVRYGCYRSRPESMIAAITIGVHRQRGTWEDNIDVFLALTDFMKAIIVRSGIAAEKIVVKPNSAPDPGRRPEAVANSDTVVFVGRLSPEKGIDRLVEAWNVSTPPGLRLKVVGDGPLLRDLEKQASASIEFVGSVPSSEVQKHLLSARALVFPSIWYEGFGLTIVEAFAAGVPVLANNLGAMSSLVKPLGSDWLLEDRRSWPKALADLADSRRIAASGSLARKLYDKMYTGHANLLALEAAYARAVEEGP
ncbi:MAG: glycosyltransferase [Acidobacteria bacterium]|nr:glycosyltransferase [Acidobacteriota bacterium]